MKATSVIEKFVKSIFPPVVGRKFSTIRGVGEIPKDVRSKKSCFAGYTDEKQVWVYDGEKFRQEEDCIDEVDYWGTDGSFTQYPPKKSIKECLKEGDKFVFIVRYSDYEHDNGNDLVQTTLYEIKVD